MTRIRTRIAYATRMPLVEAVADLLDFIDTFQWDSSLEGWHFWAEVHDKLEAMKEEEEP